MRHLQRAVLWCKERNLGCPLTCNLALWHLVFCLRISFRRVRRKAILASPWNLAPGPGPGTWEEFGYIH